MTIEKIFKLTSSVGFIGMLAMVVLMYCQKPLRQAQGPTIKEVHHHYDSTERAVPVAGAPGTVSFYPAAPSGTFGTSGTIDTAFMKAIIARFFATYTYSQEIRDTAMVATIFDSISENRIIGRRFTRKLIGPVRTVESSTVFAQKTGFYFGGFAYLPLRQAQVPAGTWGIGPSASFITKKDALLNARVDFINRAGMVGAEFKIR